MSNIKDIIISINTPIEGFIFKEHSGMYWGKDRFGNVVFGLVSEEKTKSIIESTKSLSLYLNVLCEVYYDSIIMKKNLNIIVLKDIKYLDIFINMSKIFLENQTNYSFMRYFLYLRELFGVEGKKDIKELQGLFGELFTMKYFKSILGKDISPFYQSKSKMKFDYSFSDNKKMDVKTTLKEERIHHFKNEQLNSLRYDIKIASVLLLRDDKGLSLFDLIHDCKIIFSHSLTTWFNIEKMVKNFTEAELKSISFNEKYLIDGIRIFDSTDIPKLTEKTKDGIFNVEFDSNLTTCNHMTLTQISEWINDN